MVIELVVYINFYTNVLFQFGEAQKLNLHVNIQGLRHNPVRVALRFRLGFGGMALLFSHFILLKGRCLFDRMGLGDLDTASVCPDKGAIALLVCLNRSRLGGGGWLVSFHEELKQG